mmetsp:Transcript_30694/g.85989  ORF Transcript_30694/g.85989 Transcript_30694/m.85989 type:complete len:211 (+) Transcript_30694:952-1584(+)
MDFANRFRSSGRSLFSTDCASSRFTTSAIRASSRSYTLSFMRASSSCTVFRTFSMGRSETALVICAHRALSISARLRSSAFRRCQLRFASFSSSSRNRWSTSWRRLASMASRRRSNRPQSSAVPPPSVASSPFVASSPSASSAAASSSRASAPLGGTPLLAVRRAPALEATPRKKRRYKSRNLPMAFSFPSAAARRYQKRACSVLVGTSL